MLWLVKNENVFVLCWRSENLRDKVLLMTALRSSQTDEHRFEVLSPLEELASKSPCNHALWTFLVQGDPSSSSVPPLTFGGVWLTPPHYGGLWLLPWPWGGGWLHSPEPNGGVWLLPLLTRGRLAAHLHRDGAAGCSPLHARAGSLPLWHGRLAAPLLAPVSLGFVFPVMTVCPLLIVGEQRAVLSLPACVLSPCDTMYLVVSRGELFRRDLHGGSCFCFGSS